MLFVEEKICISKKDLFKNQGNFIATQTSGTVIEKPVETILCQIISRILKEQEAA